MKIATYFTLSVLFLSCIEPKGQSFRIKGMVQTFSIMPCKDTVLYTKENNVLYISSNTFGCSHKTVYLQVVESDDLKKNEKLSFDRGTQFLILSIGAMDENNNEVEINDPILIESKKLNDFSGATFEKDSIYKSSVNLEFKGVVPIAPECFNGYFEGECDPLHMVSFKAEDFPYSYFYSIEFLKRLESCCSGEVLVVYLKYKDLPLWQIDKMVIDSIMHYKSKELNIYANASKKIRDKNVLQKNKEWIKSRTEQFDEWIERFNEFYEERKDSMHFNYKRNCSSLTNAYPLKMFEIRKRGLYVLDSVTRSLESLPAEE